MDIRILCSEIYKKQTQRNHTVILGPNGKQKLTVPVVKQKDKSTPISEIRIHQSDDYIKSHLHSISTAYGSSPFYDSFYPLLEQVYLKNFELLLQLNTSVLNVICKILNIEHIPLDQESLIATIPEFTGNHLTYSQVFSYKFGFESNLSIMDLIFNEGPYATTYLSKIKQGAY